MKKLIILAALMLMISVPAVAQASFVQNLDPARFWVVDDNSISDDNLVALELAEVGIIGSGNTLQYSLDNAAWTDVNFSAPLVIATGDDDWELVYFRLALGDGGYDTSAAVSFIAPDGELFNSVLMNWGSFQLTMAVAGDNDNVAPVPVPAAVWLFGSGLMGLIGLRRKISA